LVWQQWLGSEDQDAAFLIKNAKNGGFWVGGYSNAGTLGTGPISPFLMKLDAGGNSLGERFWPLDSPSPVYDMAVLNDTSFYFCGISDNQGFLMKRTNPQLENTFIVSTFGTKSKDPAFYFDYEKKSIRLKQANGGVLSITDLAGRTILESKPGEEFLEYQKLAGGLYIARHISNESIRSVLFRK